MNPQVLFSIVGVFFVVACMIALFRDEELKEEQGEAMSSPNKKEH
jgi:hypothetical protein